MRDGARHLRPCVASLRAQTLDEVEYVVVDDGSTDATPEILERWAQEDDRVRLLRRPRRAGRSDRDATGGAGRLVRALELARGEARAPVLARMDHDDIAHPERLEAQLSLLDRRPEVVLCGCGVEAFPPSALGAGSRRYQRWLNGLVEHADIERDLFVECPVAHPTFMARAEAVETVGGYRDRGWPEDYDLLLRLWESGGRFAKVPRVLLRWRHRPGRLSRTSPAYAPEAFRRLKVDVLRRTLLAGRPGVVIWGAGPTGKAFSRGLAAVGVSVAGFVDLDPSKIGQQIHGAQVVAPEGVEAFRECFCLAAVGQEGAREQIRAALLDSGWREMVEFCTVA